MTHQAYIIPNVIDGSVMHKQAVKRLIDKRNPEETVVHEHALGSPCNDRCVIYKLPQMECPDCEGVGRVKPDENAKGLGRKYVEGLCPTCKGMGEIRDPDASIDEDDEEVKEVL